MNRFRQRSRATSRIPTSAFTEPGHASSHSDSTSIAVNDVITTEARALVPRHPRFVVRSPRAHRLLPTRRRCLSAEMVAINEAWRVLSDKAALSYDANSASILPLDRH